MSNESRRGRKKSWVETIFENIPQIINTHLRRFMIVYLEYPKEFTSKLLALLSELSSYWTQGNTQKLTIFLDVLLRNRIYTKMIFLKSYLTFPLSNTYLPLILILPLFLPSSLSLHVFLPFLPSFSTFIIWNRLKMLKFCLSIYLVI